MNLLVEGFKLDSLAVPSFPSPLIPVSPNSAPLPLRITLGGLGVLHGVTASSLGTSSSMDMTLLVCECVFLGDVGDVEGRACARVDGDGDDENQPRLGWDGISWGEDDAGSG